MMTYRFIQKMTVVIPLLLISHLHAAEVNEGLTIAIFVPDSTSTELSGKATLFEQKLAEQFREKGYQVVRQRTVANSLKSLTSIEASQNTKALPSEPALLQALSEKLKADYFYNASLLSFEEKQRDLSAYDVDLVNFKYTLETSGEIIDPKTGLVLHTETDKSSRTIQQTKKSITKKPGIIDLLIEKASLDLVEAFSSGIEKSQTMMPTPAVEEGIEVPITVEVENIRFPEIVFDREGNPRMTPNFSAIQALSVTVEVNGKVLGTTGTTSPITVFNLPEGMQRIRLSRDDLISWDRTILVQKGMRLNISMLLTPEALAEWKSKTEPFGELRYKGQDGIDISDKIRNYTLALRESGFISNLTEPQNPDKLQIEANRSAQVQQN